jgi:hypothetical protein
VPFDHHSVGVEVELAVDARATRGVGVDAVVVVDHWRDRRGTTPAK